MRTLKRTAFDVITAMTDNGNFLAPKPDALVMAERAQNFTVALNDCKTGDRTKIALKNAVRALLVEGIAQWRLYVLSESNNNRAIAGTSGFTISPEPASREPLTKPDPLKVSNGNNSGELVLKGKRVPNAISYIFQIATLENILPTNGQVSPALKLNWWCLIYHLAFFIIAAWLPWVLTTNWYTAM